MNLGFKSCRDFEVKLGEPKGVYLEYRSCKVSLHRNKWYLSSFRNHVLTHIWKSNSLEVAETHEISQMLNKR